MSLASRLIAGNRALPASEANQRAPKAATRTVTVTSPGMPKIPEWDAETAVRVAYQGCVTVMRCVNVIADDISALPFKAGADPSNHKDINLAAPLSQLLGPPTKSSPGGPNPETSARMLWRWSIIQRLLTGRFAWEIESNVSSVQSVRNLWPLMGHLLIPIPDTSANSRYFAGYQYRLPYAWVPYTADQVFYSWRPSQIDWREPESPLQAAALPTSVLTMMERYLLGLAKNSMVARKLVVTPPFAENEVRAAFQDQFVSDNSGVENAGKTMFAEAEDELDDRPGTASHSIQVFDLATSPTDSKVIELMQEVNEQIRLAFGVPKSKLGDSSGRTFDNAGQEDVNYWRDTIVSFAHELADDVNTRLAPRMGNDFGWFDLSGIEAVQARALRAAFAATPPLDLINAGLLSPNEWRVAFGIEPFAGEDALKSPINPVIVPEPKILQPPPADPTKSPPPVRAFTEADASELIPVGPSAKKIRHVFAPGNSRRVCIVCGQAASNNIHIATGGSDTLVYARKRRSAKAAVRTHSDLVEQQMLDVLGALFARQAKATEDRLAGRRGQQMMRAADPDGQLVYDQTHWVAETQAAVGAVLATAATLTSGRLGVELGAGHNDELAVTAARQAMASRSARLAQLITETTARGITKAVQGPPGEVAQNVRAVFDKAIGERAKTIAETEVPGAMNQAAHSYVMALPEQSGLRKMWVARNDGRTRVAHQHASGQRRAVDDWFNVDGYRMRFPGDPEAPVELVANCRCHLLFLPAQAEVA